MLNGFPVYPGLQLQIGLWFITLHSKKKFKLEWISEITDEFTRFVLTY